MEHDAGFGVGSSFNLPPLSPLCSPLRDADTPLLYDANQEPAFQGYGQQQNAEQPSTSKLREDDPLKAKALRARNSAAQKRYQAKQKVRGVCAVSYVYFGWPR